MSVTSILSKLSGESKPALESEAALIGGLILDCKLFVNVRHKLCAADFYNAKNQVIYEAMANLWEKHHAFDAPMLLDYLQYEDSLDMARIYDLANDCCSTANLGAHADIIREKSVQRQLIACAQEVEMAAPENQDVDEMAHDFSNFTYVIQPSFDGDLIHLILVTQHNLSNKNTNCLIDANHIRELGNGYLFSLMQEQTTILKSILQFEGANQTLADLHQLNQ